MTELTNEQLAEENRDLIALIGLIVDHLLVTCPQVHDLQYDIRQTEEFLQKSVEKQMEHRKA